MKARSRVGANESHGVLVAKREGGQVKLAPLPPPCINKNKNKDKKKKDLPSGQDDNRNCCYCHKHHASNQCWHKHKEENINKSRDATPNNKANKGNCVLEAIAMVASVGGHLAKPKDTSWYVDSGASTHMSPFRDSFVSFKET